MLQLFPLEGVPHGKVHLKLQWFSLKDDPTLPTEVTPIACLATVVRVASSSPLLLLLAKLKLSLPVSVQRRLGFSHASRVPGQRLKPAGKTLLLLLLLWLLLNAQTPCIFSLCLPTERPQRDQPPR